MQAPRSARPGAWGWAPSAFRAEQEGRFAAHQGHSKHRGLRDSDVYFLSSNISGADGPRRGEPLCAPGTFTVVLVIIPSPLGHPRHLFSSTLPHWGHRQDKGEAWRSGAVPVRGHGAGPWGAEARPGLGFSPAHAPSLLHGCSSRPQVPDRTVSSQEDERQPGCRSRRLRELRFHGFGQIQCAPAETAATPQSGCKNCESKLLKMPRIASELSKRWF